jgi:hypothetical protein
MSCILRISASDIQARLTALRVQPYRIDRGTAHFRVSNRDFEDLQGQIQDALEFLEQHCKDLNGVMTSGALGSLDFAVNIPEGGFATRSFPAPLVKAAAGMGLSLDLSIYPNREEHDAQPQIQSATPLTDA